MSVPERILYLSRGGIGNVIQQSVALLPLSRRYSVDVYHSSTESPGALDVLEGMSGLARVYRPGERDQIEPGNYVGQVFSYWAQRMYPHVRLGGLPEFCVDLDVLNEVEGNLSAVGRIPGLGLTGYTESEYRAFVSVDCSSVPVYDVCIHAGGFNTPIWLSKKWVGYPELAERLLTRGLTVCSIGLPDEHVSGTANETGRPLMESINVALNSRMFVCNDTGTYHGVAPFNRTAVIFTSTSVAKNYCSWFHWKAAVVQGDLPCQPCQGTPMWGACPFGLKCREMPDAGSVLNTVLSGLDRQAGWRHFLRSVPGDE